MIQRNIQFESHSAKFSFTVFDLASRTDDDLVGRRCDDSIVIKIGSCIISHMSIETSNLGIVQHHGIFGKLNQRMIVDQLRILIDDEVPAACATISLTPEKWYYGIDYVTGNAATAKRQPISVTVPESYVGTIGDIAVSVFGLSGANEWTTNVSITAAGLGGETIGSASIVGAPFKRNRATEYHGSLFGAAGSMVVSVNNDWDDSVTGTW